MCNINNGKMNITSSSGCINRLKQECIIEVANFRIFPLFISKGWLRWRCFLIRQFWISWRNKKLRDRISEVTVKRGVAELCFGWSLAIIRVLISGLQNDKTIKLPPSPHTPCALIFFSHGYIFWVYELLLLLSHTFKFTRIRSFHRNLFQPNLDRRRQLKITKLQTREWT